MTRTLALLTLQLLGFHFAGTIRTENFPPCSPQTKFGKSRDAIGSRIGLLGKSYAKGRKVVAMMDSEHREGNVSSVSTLRTALDKSIDAAYKLAIKPQSTREAIAQMLKK